MCQFRFPKKPNLYKLYLEPQNKMPHFNKYFVLPFPWSNAWLICVYLCMYIYLCCVANPGSCHAMQINLCSLWLSLVLLGCSQAYSFTAALHRCLWPYIQIIFWIRISGIRNIEKFLEYPFYLPRCPPVEPSKVIQILQIPDSLWLRKIYHLNSCVSGKYEAGVLYLRHNSLLLILIWCVLCLP